jgi:hypothetical protein
VGSLEGRPAVTFPVPVVQGVIARRLLLNFRVRPEVLAAQLPRPFRPKLVRGFGLAGICLIRLEQVRPRGLPAFVGLSSENAAHRIAAQWTEQGRPREGVFIPRRDTNVWLNRLLGGRLFPGWHHAADFAVEDDGDQVALKVQSRDGKMALNVRGRSAARLPSSSVFGSLEEASEFFQAGAVGWSLASRPGCCEGLELACERWIARPFAVETVGSSYFNDPNLFLDGSVEFDSALVMRGIHHCWRAVGHRKLEQEWP